MPVKVLEYAHTMTPAFGTTFEFRDNRRLRKKPIAQLIPPMRSFYSEQEAFNLLFPDEESKRISREESQRLDEELLVKIRTGKVNPIRGWRILRGMDQKTLSLLTGIRQPNLSRMEKLGVQPSRENLKKISKVLDIDIKELL